MSTKPGAIHVYSSAWIKGGEMQAGFVEARFAMALGIDHPMGNWTRRGGIDLKAIERRADASTELYCARQGCID